MKLMPIDLPQNLRLGKKVQKWLHHVHALPCQCISMLSCVEHSRRTHLCQAALQASNNPTSDIDQPLRMMETSLPLCYAVGSQSIF